MKNLLLVTILLFFNISLVSQTLRAFTYNIRYANNNPGEEWDLRKDNLATLIKAQNSDIFGVQEAVFSQVEFLAKSFNNFQQIGVGREDGLNEGEFSALFISDKFKIEKSGTFWLSSTPQIPSLGWDASYKRVATWAVILEKNSNKSIFVINTHLDHQGIVAQNEGVKLILSQISELSQNLPIILMGDFNFTTEFEGYKNIVDSGFLKDAQFETSNTFGNNITFNGFNNQIEVGDKIDYIFVSKNIKVLMHKIIWDKYDSKFPSDHMPVLIDFELEK